MAGLSKQLESNPLSVSKDGYTPIEQIRKNKAIVKTLLALRHRIFYNDILPKLQEYNIHLRFCKEFTSLQLKTVEQYFEENIFPILTPLAFDPGHPFPYISNLSLSLAVKLRDIKTGELKFARVKVPTNLPRIVPASEIFSMSEITSNFSEHTFIWTEDIISTFCFKLFPNLAIEAVHLFRITRDTDLDIGEDEAHDLLETISESLWKQRYGKVVKLDIASGMPDDIKKILITNFNISNDQVYIIDGILGLSALMELYNFIDIPELKNKPFLPKRTYFPSKTNLLSRIDRHDKLLFHPYDSFDVVIDLLEEATNDPDVIAIKQTLYRVGSKSPIVDALADAARQGKQVAAVIELKARFDEENNIVWAKKLEHEGVHVIYGILGLKVHSKMLLIVKKDGTQIKRYVHLGTGNYNLASSKMYTDYSFFTSDKAITQDVSEIFNYLTGYSRQTSFRSLLVSPLNMREGLLSKINREVELGSKGKIIFKMNSLVDEKIIQALYRASQEGVKIDLIIRGVCTLIPQIEKMSENIRVVSVIGRFLEHSRIFYFFNDGKEELYLGSADLMERNLDRRVEVLFPILNHVLREEIKSHLNIILKDVTNTWELSSNGKYREQGKLECVINQQDQLLDPTFLSVICHPHPLFQGTMHNKVVVTLMNVLVELGGAVLRFNFRGVTESEGVYSDGIGELNDLKFAVAHIQTKYNYMPNLSLVLAGFSFGAHIALKFGATFPSATLLLGLGLPLRLFTPNYLHSIKQPTLIMFGDNDEFNPMGRINQLIQQKCHNHTFQIISNSDHFFTGSQHIIKACVKEWLKDDPAFFENLAMGQNPSCLYIGCSDSRVTAEELLGASPGEIFVHRNIANQVISNDNNLNAVVQYAVEYLRVQHIIVCGHYECGGVSAALNPSDMGQLNSWLQPLRDVYRIHRVELDVISDPSRLFDRLVELNVLEQCLNIIKIDHVQRSWYRANIPQIHGWVFDVRTGRLIDLGLDMKKEFESIRRIYDLHLL
ncbi:hypothetical protein CHS0354_023966 [Potamilus streckersoni]|uniref:carbonic anhydrase n=1 Tax=Potamilus streckersoni TaxID=2493646 RepID=A0AAE0VMR7_9BIVA|nr:hypothetical protein CHS0354_023966 [Potamilus streckersoni]